jgi:hypothetical protein
LIRVLDISKYTNQSGGTYRPITDAIVQAWLAEGIGLVVCQVHPAGYGDTLSIADLACLQRNGMPVEVYIYQYLTDRTWTIGSLQTLAAARAQGVDVKFVWLDVEDVSPGGKALTQYQRADAIRQDLSLIAAAELPYGIYSGGWWWNAYCPNIVEFAGLPLWDSNYDGRPDPDADFHPYGGWSLVTLKQYAGTSVDVTNGLDLDVARDDYLSTLGGDDMALSPIDDATIAKFTLSGPQDYVGLVANLNGVCDTYAAQVADLQAQLDALKAKVAQAVAELS